MVILSGIFDGEIRDAADRFRRARGVFPWQAEPSLLDPLFTQAEREAVIRLYLLIEGFRVGNRVSTLAVPLGAGRIRPPPSAA